MAKKQVKHLNGKNAESIKVLNARGAAAVDIHRNVQGFKIEHECGNTTEKKKP
jgi:hypothetical protein